MKKPTELEIQEELDRRMRSEYVHPIEVFPQKIDQFLEAINRVCLPSTRDGTGLSRSDRIGSDRPV